jgi:hypothetical protein
MTVPAKKVESLEMIVESKDRLAKICPRLQLSPFAR